VRSWPSWATPLTDAGVVKVIMVSSPSWVVVG
jgi:hypothetical protein